MTDTPKKSKGTEALEMVSSLAEELKLWAFKAYQIGTLMVKGAYLVQERRRLIVKLGQEALDRIHKGEIKAPDLDALVKRIEQLSEKVETEEAAIRKLRFGSKEGNTDHAGLD